MNRKLTPLFFLTVTGLCAQPTIPQVLLAVGDVLLLDVAFPITDAGPGGNNVTWDFGTSSFSGTQWTYTAQTAASTPLAAEFPAATMALFSQLSTDLSGYFFFDFNAGFTEHGEWLSDGTEEYPDVNSDPLTFFTTPLSATSTGSDTYANIIGIGGGLDEIAVSGTHTWAVDGYGTLVLPNATYTDVLRIHAIQSETNTITVSGIEISFDVYREEWWWVKAGVPFPLLVYSLETEDGETNPSSRAALIGFNGATSIAEQAALPIRVYPNPVRDVVTMELEANGTVQYRVLDPLGREALHGSVSAGGTLRHSIDFAALNTGIYQLEVRSQQGIATARLVKE
ncbi:MAG TPA: T9SS type A sorting domain-containing protein [Flavobacteriales bacterium]|nr:T9SS type A sorting domain-containing protein [Flavobacteriales bacterium]